MNSPQTLTQLFFDAVERFSTKRAALRYKQAGEWHDITHRELAQRVKHAAVGLIELGVKPGDRIAILSQNCPEWAVADYACLTARCADVPVYPTIPANQVAYILRDAGACIAFVEDDTQYAKVAAHRHELPDLKHVILFRSGDITPDTETFDDLFQRGAAAVSRYPGYRDDACTMRPDDLATIIYTSGTTGDPKGVMLTHSNITSNVTAALQVLNIGPEDSCLSVLPLSHSFERMAGHYTMFHAGATINYVESIEEFASNMMEVKPTIALLVPRIYEKIYGRVLENAMAGGALKRRIFFWARRTADRWADLSLAGQVVPRGLALKKKIAHKLVFSKLHKRTGGRIRFFVSGAAPLSPEIAKFFYAAGLRVVEGYGLTESSPVIAVNPLDAIRIGSVGPAVPGVEVRVAEDGEILARGPNIMKGYYRLPEATAESVDADGWLHTGDIGELDSAGYLRITDRKKDIIVTAGGKNIAPQPIENTVKLNKFVANALLIGDRRKFPVIMVVPDFEAVASWADGRGLSVERDQLSTDPDIGAMLEREVMGALRGLASYEMPKKVILLDRDFTIEDGSLTPSLKVKRRVVEERYRDRIEEAYRE